MNGMFPSNMAIAPPRSWLNPSQSIQIATSTAEAAVEPPALTEHVMESLLAQELRRMSLRDREAINEEIHGVYNLAVQETPQLLLEKLAEMDELLLLLHQQPNDEVIGTYSGQNGNSNSTSTSAAYNEALMLGSQYIHKPAFRLMFLRAELFDATKAATRFVNFLQLIRDYLGPDALVHEPWTLRNFTADELKIYKQGDFQIFGRDQIGRLVHGMVDDTGINVSVVTRLKIHLYTYMTMAEDVETQQKGAVALFYQNNQSMVLSNHEERTVLRIALNFAPIRMSAGHICLPNTPLFSILKALVLATAPPSLRARCRFHTGSPTEILYSLQTFGISADQIPINSSTGKSKTQHFLKWVNMRQAMEEAKANGGPNFIFQGIDFPRHQDVLLGRGRPNLIHRGNIAMRHAVESRLARFAATSDKDEKAAIIWEVVEETYLLGGRFLKEDPGKTGWWLEVDQEAAKQKVGTYFRDLKSIQRSSISVASALRKTNKAIGSRLSQSPTPLSPPSMQPAGCISSEKDSLLPKRQELASSTYEFLETSSRAHKRCKGSHFNEICCDVSV